VFNSPENNKPCRHKLVSDKQIKFKEFCVSWNKFHKNLPRDSFKIFFENNWFYMKYIVQNRGWRILMSMYCTYDDIRALDRIYNNTSCLQRTLSFFPHHHI
jgi:hypothetical protein